jgi:integrase
LVHFKDMRDTVSVSECKHPRYSHRVRFPGPAGKRVDRFFTNETDALIFAKDQRKETGETGTAFGSISETERSALAFWRAFVETTTPPPPDLVSVMKDFKTSWLASKASITVTKAIAQFITHHEADGSSSRHVASLKSRLGRFERDLGKSLVSSISTSTFTEWLNALRATRADRTGAKLTAVTRHNLTRSLRSFFVFAVERGWTLSNPVPAAKRSKSNAVKLATRTAPAVMLPENVERFMKALQTQAPALVPFWSLKFFAGIRDAEASRMDWAMIDLKGKKIHLPAKVTKTGEARTVKIQPALAAWLKPFLKESGKVALGATTRKRGFKKTIESLATTDSNGEITESFDFPSNAARHSFGTYHLFHFRNAGETALQLGHKGNPAMLHEHYKNPAAEKHAAKFWRILPDAAANVIPIDLADSHSEENKPAAKKRKLAR